MTDPHTNHHHVLRATLADIEQLLRSADLLALSQNARGRLCWFAHAIANGGNVRKTCAHFGIAPSTFARWARRFDPSDISSLEERSKRPQRTRTSTVSPEIVERIRQCRTEDPHINRDRIREKLIADYGVTLSSSSIGRVIRQHGFFFAQTPAHWIKRAGSSAAQVTEEAVTDRLVAEQLRATQDAFAQWAALLDEPERSFDTPGRVMLSRPERSEGRIEAHDRATQDDTAKGSGDILPSLLVLLTSSLIFGAFFFGGSKAYALEGSSYRLYGDFAAETTSGPLTGAQYSLEEGGVTDTSQPLAGSSYQITSAPPATASSSSSTSSSSSSSATGGGGGGGGGRDRGRAALAAAQETSSSREAEAQSSTHVPLPAPLIGTEPSLTGPRHGAAPLPKAVTHPSPLPFRFPSTRPSPMRGQRRRNILSFGALDPIGNLCKTPFVTPGRVTLSSPSPFGGAQDKLREGVSKGGHDRATQGDTFCRTSIDESLHEAAAEHGVENAIALFANSLSVSALFFLGIGALGLVIFPFRRHRIFLSGGMPVLHLRCGSSAAKHRRFHRPTPFGISIFLPFFAIKDVRKKRCRTTFHSNPIYRHRSGKGFYTKKGIRLSILVLALLSGTLLFWGVTRAFAATSAPLTHTYHGHLLNSSGNAVTTAVTIRFSYWKSADFVSGDLTATGAINTSATNYVSWKEEHTLTPNSNGYFSVELGSVTTLPTMNGLPLSTLLSLFLQVEVKASGAADSTYDLLDSNTSDATKDRTSVLSVPFALNADMLDQRDTGTASGSIPVLRTGGLLPVSAIPGGTTQSGFTLDTGNAAASGITLQFGQSLAKKLTFDQTNSRFNFNDDLRIQGDLTVTGLINGITLSAIQSATGTLKVSSGGGLTIKVDAGSYRLKGTVTNFAGQSNIAVAANATNYVFFGSGGLTVRTATFPTDESYIPLAQVTTNTISVTSVVERRALSSDDRERTITRAYHANFEGATYQGDASDNVGQLYTDHDSSNLWNFYRWSSSLTSLQDYDIILRATLPDDFVRWNTGSGNHLRVKYRSTSASTADNQLDVSVFDTNGSLVTLSGSGLSSGQNLAGTSWTTEQIEWTGAPTWTAGHDFLIKLKLQAKNDKQMHIGDLILEYIELPSE